MELISFIKGLRKKGKSYYDVWLPILFELEEKNHYKINRRLDISQTQYYRIISFGVQLWSELVTSTTLEYTRGNLSINFKSVPKKSNSKTKAEQVVKDKKEAESVDMNEVYDSIISYLNQKAKTGYQSTTNSYRTFINARIKAGATLEDFYAVIDNKCSEWMGTDFQKFVPKNVHNGIINKSKNEAMAFLSSFTKMPAFATVFCVRTIITPPYTFYFEPYHRL